MKDIEKIVKLYDPANAKSLTADEVAAMQDLTPQELKALAEAYPNKATQTGYLVLKHKGTDEKKQSYPLSTWKNLYGLFRLGNKNYVPFSFASIFNVNKLTKVKGSTAQDISPDDAKAELKSAAPKNLKPDKEKTKMAPAKGETEQTLEEDKVDLQGDDNNKALELELEGMSKPQLTERYKLALGEDPDKKLTKVELASAIFDAERKS